MKTSTYLLAACILLGSSQSFARDILISAPEFNFDEDIKKLGIDRRPSMKIINNKYHSLINGEYLTLEQARKKQMEFCGTIEGFYSPTCNTSEYDAGYDAGYQDAINNQ